MELIETIVANSYQWLFARVNAAKKVAEVHEVSENTTLEAQMNALINLLKKL